MSKHLRLLALTSILLLAAYLRLANIADNPGWYTDEGTHLDLARNLLHGEARYLALRDSALLVARPPLFHFLLAGSMSLLGEDMLALRTLTALLGIVSVAVVSAARLDDEPADGLPWMLAGLWLALSPSAILYSRFGFSYNALAPLVLLLWRSLWRFWRTQQPRWLALASVSAGLGLVTDLWMGVLLPALAMVTALRQPRALVWSLPLAGLPLSLYAASSLLTTPAAFLFDVRYTFARLNIIPFDQQAATLADNLVNVAWQEPWFALGLASVILMRPASARNLGWLICGSALVLLGRSVALYSLSTYYLIPLFPFAALGWAAAVVELRRLTQARWRLALAVGIAVALTRSAQDGLKFADTGWPTPIDSFLVEPAEARAAAQFVDTRLGADEVVVASPAVAWLITGQAADFQMAVAATGQATPHLPADIPPERFAFDPRFATARYLIVDDLWRNWAAVHLPPVDALLATLDNQPPEFESGRIRVYARR